MDSTGLNETKSEIRARLEELNGLRKELDPWLDGVALVEADRMFEARIRNLESAEESAEEDLFRSVVDSHKVLCEVKKMDEKAAYGQNPAVYYGLGICGEAGEMGNKIVKALRNGDDPDAAKKAVEKELPDVIIYSAVLAHVMDVDLTRLVNEKVQVVIQRALDGYYGGPLDQGMSLSSLSPEETGLLQEALRHLGVDGLRKALDAARTPDEPG